MPGIEAASVASLVPFGAFSESRRVEPVGGDAADARSATFTLVGDDYFRSLGLSMLRGREFTDAEIRADDGPSLVIVDDTLARGLWPDTDPLGRQVQFRQRDTGQLGEVLTVIGIAPGRRSQIFDQQPTSHIYVPANLEYRANMNIHLRLAAGGREASVAMVQTVREEMRQFDNRLPVFALHSLEDFRADSAGLWAVQVGASVFSTFGALALFLAVVGLYGVKSYVVSQRTREIGIRMALGANRGDVLWLVLREGVVLAAVGLGLGLLLSVGTAQLLGNLLYEVSTLDPVVFALALALLAGSSVLASYLPARRATRVVPIVALRCD